MDTLLGLALGNAATRDLFVDITPVMFEDERQAAVVDYLKTSKPAAVSEVPEELQSFDEYVKIVLLRAEKRYGNWNESDQYFEVAKLLRRYKAEHEIQLVKKQKQAALDSGDEAEVQRLEQQEYLLVKEMKRA